ncbi:MAG: T9SS type A sorting domain-containing protein [Saprospiraceae bacterium]
MKKILLLNLFMALTFVAFAQPANDDWGDATDLINVGTAAGTLITLSGETSTGATADSDDFPPSTCDMSGFMPPPNEMEQWAGKEVWYSVITGQSNVALSFAANNTTANAVIDLYQGDPNNGMVLACGVAYDNSSILVDIMPNIQYYVRVYDIWAGSIASFDINASLEEKVENDDPAGAKFLDKITSYTGEMISEATPSTITSPYDNQVSPDSNDDNGSGNTCVPNWWNDVCNDLWYSILTDDIMGGVVTIAIPYTPTPNEEGTIGLFLYDQNFNLVDCTNKWNTPSLSYTIPPSTLKDGKGSSSRTESVYYIRTFGINAEPTYAIEASGTALPIHLVSFSAKARINSNMIYWTTSSEVNSDYIEVQSSIDGILWNAVGQVEAKNISHEKVNYRLEDNNPFATTYYRLNAVDLDGSTALSKVISITRQQRSNNLIVTPNPATNAVTMQSVATQKGNASISIVDFTGKVMMEKAVELTLGANSIDVDISELPVGMYLFTLNYANGTEVQKIIKQ